MADLDLKAQIELLIKGGQLPADVGKKLKNLAADAEKAKTHTERFSKALSALNGVLSAVGFTVGAAAIINFAKQSFIEFAKTERQYKAVESQLAALGSQAGVTGGQMRGMIASMSNQFGILDDDLIPAYNRLLITLGDGQAAMEALRISAKFAANGLGTIQGNAEGLATAFQTGVLRGLKSFGIQTKDASGDALNFSDALVLINENLAKLPDNLGDAQSKVDSLAIAWDNLKDRIGEVVNSLASIPQGARSIFDFLIGREPLPAVVDLVRDNPLRGTSGAGDAKALADKAAAASAAARAKAAQDADDAAQKEFAAARQLADELAAIHRQNYQDTADRLGKELKLKQETTDQAKKYDADANAFFLDQIDIAQEALRANSDQLRQLTLEGREAELNDELDLIVEGAERAYQIRKELIGLRIRDELEQERQRYADELVLLKDNLAAQEDARRNHEEIVAGIKKKGAQATVQVDRVAAQIGESLRRQATDAALGAAAAVFAGNKKASAAIALIDSFAGAARALKDYPAPYSYVIAASTLAAGLARVSAINSVTLGGGGSSGGGGGGSISGGQSERVAYIGGGGAGAQGSGASNNSNATTINIANAFGDKRSMRKLTRQIRRAGPGADSGNLR